MLQDIEFGLSMPVVIACPPALSPAINDPFTASASIDCLAAGLSIMADRGDSSPYRLDGDGFIRIIYEPVSFDHATDVAFDAIREIWPEQHHRASATADGPSEHRFS